MKDLRHNTTAKALALLMLALFALAAFGSLTGAAILQSFDAYSAKSLADCRMLDNLMDFHVDELKKTEYLFSDSSSFDFRMTYPMELEGKPVCNTVVQVTDSGGDEVLYNYHADTIPSTVRRYTLSYAFPWVSSETSFYLTPGHDNSPLTIPTTELDYSMELAVSFREWLFDSKGIDVSSLEEWECDTLYGEQYYTEYLTDICGEEIFTAPDGYFNVTLGIAKDAAKPFSKEQLAISAFEHRWAVLILGVFCFIVSLVLSVFLCFSAGWQPDSTRPVGTVVERIPLGLFLLGSFGGQYGLFLLLRLLGTKTDSVLATVLFAIILYAISLAAVATTHSLLARFKAGGWTKNTVIYRLYNIFSWVGKNLSDVGTVLLCIGGWLVINLILLAVALDRLGLGLLLMGIFNLIFAAAAVAVAAQWQKLRAAAAIIADGDSAHRIDSGTMFRPLREHAETINRIGEGVEIAVNEQMKSERMKTDLITNVSHDLKTPLTSIVSYVGLLKKEQIDNETACSYIETLERQAVRLGRLVEDLVEASRATSGSITPHIAVINTSELLEQAVSEYEYRLEQSGITPVLTVHDEQLSAPADGRLLWRVFDNLMSNVCKYALEGTRLYIDAYREDGRVTVVFRNISADRLNIPAEELMERFVRADTSRTTSGSGLGLTIAKSLVELQGGQFSLEIEGDMFKAKVVLPDSIDGLDATE